MAEGTCDLEHCDAPDLDCHLGEVDRTACKHFSSAGSDQAESSVDDDPDVVHTPFWDGKAFGLRGVTPVAARSPLQLIGLFGPTDAGKTTLLVALYLSLVRTGRVFDLNFAGSLTLGGWEDLAHGARHTAARPASFPAHTTTSGGRVPSLLHLSLASSTTPRVDVCIADAPGEWFSRWANRTNDPRAEGAKWLAANASASLLLADSEALAGPDRGDAIGILEDLAGRLADRGSVSRVALVHTKSDVSNQIPEPVQRRVRNLRESVLGECQEFSVNVKSNSGLAELERLFHWAATVHEPPVPILRRHVGTDNPFLRYGTPA